MSDAPKQIFAEQTGYFKRNGIYYNGGKWSDDEASGLTEYVRADLHEAALKAVTAERDQWIEHTKNAVWSDSEQLKIAEAEVAALRARVAELEEALADAVGALDAQGEQLSDFANILSREPWEANLAYQSAVDARAVLSKRGPK